ncbi:MAG: FkbM family methyltransferase [Pseudomonadota bacterium]
MTLPAETSDFGRFEPSRFQRVIMRMTASLPDSWLGKRIAFALRRLALSTLSGPLDVTLFEHQLRLYPFRNVCERRALFTPQYFDARERTLIGDSLPEDPVFIDIGANVGLYSFDMAGRARGQARILAIEPQAEIFERLKANIALNPGVPIIPLDCAVGAEDGTMTLFVDPTNRGQSSVRLIGDAGSETATRVTAKPLLTILHEAGLERVDAMKIDVEGAEDMILFPFFDAAPESLHPSMIVLERSDDAWHQDCRGLLRQNGYDLVAETRLNLVFQKQDRS